MNRFMKIPSLAVLAATLALAPLAACELDVPDLNNPSIDDLENNPTRVAVAGACTGLLIGNRRNYAAANGYVSQLGILGRESYNLDASDPRFINELLRGSLQKGSPFGGNFWTLPYANIRLANIVEAAAAKVTDEPFSAAEQSAIVGFAETIEAMDLLEVVITHDTNGGVIDTDRPVDAELAPMVSKDAMYTEIARLLDDAATKLAAGGAAFPFALTNGYAGFDDPPGFLRFNRGMRARVAVYMKDYPAAITALGASFVNAMVASPTDFDTGVYHTYSIGAGDVTNALVASTILVHPTFITQAQAGDQRVVRKTRTTSPVALQMLSSDKAWTMYGPSSPVPILRNEELLLLRSEARWFTNDKPGAMADLNVVRTQSGGLTAIVGIPATDMAYITALLYERRYSLAFEGGHRWIDLRRFERIMELPLDVMTHVRNVRYPIPRAECNARPAEEPACMGGSQ